MTSTHVAPSSNCQKSVWDHAPCPLAILLLVVGCVVGTVAMHDDVLRIHLFMVMYYNVPAEQQAVHDHSGK